MTGHLVLSTLHTNTTIGAINRLKDLGIDTYLISSSLNCVIAQRLLRKYCINCKDNSIKSGSDYSENLVRLEDAPHVTIQDIKVELQFLII